MSDKERGSRVQDNPAFGGKPHRRNCLCVLGHSRGHHEQCQCWICESARWFFWPLPEPKRVLVSTDVTAAHLRTLGLSGRAIARELDVSPSTAHKLMTPGRTALRETVDRALALGRSNGAG